MDGDEQGQETFDPELGVPPHERLDAYRVSRRFAVWSKRLCATIDGDENHLRDHLKRSSKNVVLLIAEGANRRSPGMKRLRFEEALGEVGECLAAIDMVRDDELGDLELASEARRLGRRLSAMLAALERKFKKLQDSR